MNLMYQMKICKSNILKNLQSDSLLPQLKGKNFWIKFNFIATRKIYPLILIQMSKVIQVKKKKAIQIKFLKVHQCRVLFQWIWRVSNRWVNKRILHLRNLFSKIIQGNFLQIWMQIASIYRDQIRNWVKAQLDNPKESFSFQSIMIKYKVQDLSKHLKWQKSNILLHSKKHTQQLKNKLRREESLN